MNFILTDSNVARVAAEKMEQWRQRYDAELIVIPAGEDNKSLATVAEIWRRLSEAGATRSSTLVCFGGGMVTDIGGFAAACFKRGIPHVNVATTLLAAVDAAVGGKTGIDFNGLKNEVGAFRMPQQSFAEVETFATLPPREMLSGWGEAIKTAMIDSEEMTRKMMAEDPLAIPADRMAGYVGYCRSVKERIVAEDPTEKGLRKVLNLGHTAGHAFESLMLEKGTPIPHGCAVAHGLLVTLVLSAFRAKGESAGSLQSLQSLVSRYSSWLKEYYGILPVTCRDHDRLFEIALHDKKNESDGTLRFVLLEVPGIPLTDCPVSRDDFLSALAYAY